MEFFLNFQGSSKIKEDYRKINLIKKIEKTKENSNKIKITENQKIQIFSALKNPTPNTSA